MGKFGSLAVLILVTAPVSAQYGQYPPGQYPPGQSPSGQYPPGQSPGSGGISIPTRSKKKKQSETKQPDFTAEGRTLSNDGKKLVIGTNDGRTITMTLTDKTKFTRSGADIARNAVTPRTAVHIEAAEDDQAFLTAISVDVMKEVPENVPGDSAAANADGHSPATSPDTPPEELAAATILHPDEAPDRPILRHGAPKRASTDEDTGEAPAKPTATAQAKPGAAESTPAHEGVDFTINSDSEEPRIAQSGSPTLVSRSKEWSQTFTNGLPNYVCQQMTTRYAEQSKATGWEAQDVVTAKVVYEDGKEEYKEITVGGKRTNKSMLELGGSTSTGEFASTLHSLFSDASRAQFKLSQSTTIGNTQAAVYDFKVALPNSDWFINVGGQSLRPAYSGSVWIDKKTAEVRRIEMSADNVPKDFPMDTMLWAVDYESIPLGTSKFLLPVHAENISCQRGSTICSKNETDFRDYHKYSGESTIEFK